MAATPNLVRLTNTHTESEINYKLERNRSFDSDRPTVLDRVRGHRLEVIGDVEYGYFTDSEEVNSLNIGGACSVAEPEENGNILVSEMRCNRPWILNK